ncbi:hypothetical protein HaLaN_05763 [Haematococcus lacustris]|uniref:FAD synthase middle domain-containing protein n=1 Tax=Haematococcus lacustris TaxID=44745 RepID=A0A699YLR3_HAELA|nr:hypothetical protein HaLaN_05763 [Haematococcus lacustris]
MQVSIGSYPNTDPATDQLWKVRIGVSSRSQEALDEALRALQSAVPDLLPQPPMTP